MAGQRIMRRMGSDAEWNARSAAARDGMFSANVNGTPAVEVTGGRV
jgi:hypothetical protein